MKWLLTVMLVIPVMAFDAAGKRLEWERRMIVWDEVHGVREVKVIVPDAGDRIFQPDRK